MITRTIKQALLDDSTHVPGWVYVVRDGDVIFYVGISQDPAFRLCQHVGIGGAHSLNYSPEKFIADVEAGRIDKMGCSQVGRCILDNAPDSLNWSFDVYEHADASAVLAKSDPQLLPLEQHWYNLRDIVEEALINELKPYLNVTKNAHERDLPAKYRVSASAENPFIDALEKLYFPEGK